MKTYLQWHKKKYPLMTEQDLVQLIFQGFNGTTHLFFDPLPYFQKLINERSTSKTKYEDFYEYISGSYIHVHLLKSLQELSIPAFESIPSYSKLYQKAYQPSYQVVHKRCITEQMRLYQAWNYISNLQKPSIISLEGKCGAGKTTLANKLKEKLNLTVLSVDDFFLPKNRKTASRLQEVGGNIDYERIRQLLELLTYHENLTYSKYNCKTQQYEKQSIFVHDIVILEGVYSYHPYFRDLVDALMYLEVDGDIQNFRLRKRHNYFQFVNEWIPLETSYFESEHIKSLADLII